MGALAQGVGERLTTLEAVRLPALESKVADTSTADLLESLRSCVPVPCALVAGSLAMIQSQLWWVRPAQPVMRRHLFQTCRVVFSNLICFAC